MRVGSRPPKAHWQVLFRGEEQAFNVNTICERSIGTLHCFDVFRCILTEIKKLARTNLIHDESDKWSYPVPTRNQSTNQVFSKSQKRPTCVLFLWGKPAFTFNTLYDRNICTLLGSEPLGRILIGMTSIPPMPAGKEAISCQLIVSPSMASWT